MRRKLLVSIIGRHIDKAPSLDIKHVLSAIPGVISISGDAPLEQIGLEVDLQRFSFTQLRGAIERQGCAVAAAAWDTPVTVAARQGMS